MAGAKNPEERLNNLLSARLALLEALKTASTKYADIVSDTTDESEDHNKQLKDAAEAVNKLKKQYNGVRNAIKEINEEASTLVEGFKTAGDSIGSLSSLQDEFKNKLTKTALEGVVLSREIRSIGGETKESFKQALEQSSGLIETIAELANLNKEDALAIASKNEEFATKFSDLSTISKELTLNAAKGTEAEKQRAAAIASIVTELEEANKEASTFNNIDKEHGEFLKELNEDYHEIGKTFKKIGYTAETIFGSKRGFLGMALIGAGMLAEKFGELGKKIGVGMTEMVGLKTQVGLVGAILGEEAGEAALDLAKDLGDSHHLTTSMAVDAGLLAANYSLSGKQAAFMSVAFGELSGKSYETGKNTGEFVKQLAISNGVAPTQVMQDVADNTEFFALYSKDGGKNIGEAAVAAAKLGVGLDVAAKVADHLLDYQTSVTDEMEASVLLGRDVNLGKARQLMYDGKIAEGMQAGLEAAGGINEYNKMDYYQRQALAKALGVSNTELQQMVAHEETLKGMHGVANKLYSQSSDLLQYMGNTLTGKVLKGMGGLVLSGAQFGAHLSQMGIKIPMLTNALKFMMSPVKALANGFMSIIGFIGKAIAKMIGFKAVAATTNIGADALTSGTSMAAGGIPKGGRKKARFLKGLKNTAAVAPSVSTPPVEKLKPTQTPRSALDKVGSPTQMLAAGFAMLALAGAIWILSKAFQNFAEIADGNVIKTLGLFAAAIGGMALGLWAASKLITGGAVEIGIAAVLMLAFGAAITMIGYGFKLFAEGIATIANSLPVMTANFQALVMLVPLLLALAFAFSTLAFALGMLGTMGIAALPILAALAIGGGIAVALGVGGAGGKKEDTSQKLLDEIVGLRGDLNSGKVAVFLDGVKVNTILAQAGKNTITNR
jgi:hypothetical protein